MTPRTRIDAHPRYLIATNVAGFMAGAILLFSLSRIPTLLSTLALVVLILALALLFGLDIAAWYRRGIRSVELDGDALIVCRGKSLRAQRIERARVSGIRIVYRLGRRTAILDLASRRALRIAEDAFPRESFARFLSALEGWRG